MVASRRNQILIWALLGAGVLVVLLNALFAFQSVENLRQNQAWVEHTWQVIYQVERILTSEKDAETGFRGFLISDNTAYFSPYLTAQRDLPGELDEFGRLTADNPRQQARLVEMHALLDERMSLLKQEIELRRSGNSDLARIMAESEAGKAQIEHLRRLGDEMETEERQLLEGRTATARASVWRARLTIVFSSLLDLLMIGLISVHFVRERGRRIESELQAVRLDAARAQAEANAEEVRVLNATLEERVRQRTVELETTNKELEAFSYSVSHDLRAPLRTIDGFSLALAEDYSDVVDDTGRDYIGRVRTGVQRMGMLIDALLQLSRITRAEIVREPFNLSDLARQVASNLKDENPGRDLEFQVEDGLRADADPKLIQVALENLLGNAAKFTGKVEHAVVKFGWDPAQAAWCVADNGAGFDMHYASKLFNAFNRLHGDKDYKGSGIGLATVARVVRRHGGRIWADSVVEHGATFWFTLG